MQSDKILKILEAECKNEDITSWAEAAHKLKGGAGSIGADTLQSLCNQAQHFKGAIGERLELFRKNKDEYVRVKQYFKEIGAIV